MGDPRLPGRPVLVLEPTLRIYTDGGCSGNPGPGGWAYVLITPAARTEGSGGDPNTTNNRMELTAVIRALESVRSAGTPPKGIVIHTDSQYVQRGITDWIRKWSATGWKTSQGDPVKNKELWVRLLELTTELEPEWVWVKGHAGDPMNEHCDALVQKEIRRYRA